MANVKMLDRVVSAATPRKPKAKAPAASDLAAMLSAAGIAPTPMREPGEFTATEAGDAMGIDMETARRRLQQAVRAGALTARMCRIEGRRQAAMCWSKA